MCLHHHATYHHCPSCCPYAHCHRCRPAVWPVVCPPVVVQPVICQPIYPTPPPVQSRVRDQRTIHALAGK